MSTEQKTQDVAIAQKNCTNSTRIAVNVVAMVLVIAISFAAGFGVCSLVNSNRNDRDGRPDFNQMPQMNGQQQQPNMNHRDQRFTPNSENKNNTPESPSAS